MKIHQLSVFIENRPGHLSPPIKALAAAGINIATLSLADTKQFGILRIVTRQWEKAKQVLENAGLVVSVTEVLAIEAPDRPGGLADVLTVVEAAGVGVDYLYAFAEQPGGKAVLVFRFDDSDRAIDALTAAGVNVLRSVEVYGDGD
ncbi:MAG: amino acid-binding protein [Rhodopirellula sp.]|nr:amino acid-binding protein [Rhodopirellula sp.]